MASSGRYAQRRGSLPQATTTIVPFHGISSWRHTISSCMNSSDINKYRPGFRYVLVISSPKSVQYCAIGLNSNKGTKSDIEIAPAKRFEAVVQIGSGGVVVTGDKLLAGAISQQALDLRTMEAAPASRSPTAR